MRNICFIFAILLLVFSAKSFAFTPENYLDEPQEQRARELFLQIKCPVCAGQVIESSNTQIALELKKLVREKIEDGKNDEQIKAELMAEYGDDILTSPQFNKQNFLLWFLPIMFMLAGLAALLRYLLKTSGKSVF